MDYNAKDIYLERSTGNKSFEEYPLHSRPDCVVVTDTTGSISLVSTASFLQPTTSSTISASYALNSGNATNVQSDSDILVHSQGSVYMLATTNVILSATSALSMEALGGNISLYPNSTVEVYGDLNVAGTLTKNGSEYVPTSSISSSYANQSLNASVSTNAMGGLSPFILTGSDSPTFAFLSANGYNLGDVHGFLGFNGRYWSGTNTFSETARIEGIKDAPDGNAGGALIFYTNDSGNVLQERVRINRDGDMTITGSITTTGGVVGNLVGTASMATTASAINGTSDGNAPINQTTASAWMPVTVDGQTYYIPLYQ